MGPALNFGQVPVASSSTNQAVTITNTGFSLLTVYSTTTSTGFASLSGGSCPAAPFTLAPGAGCSQNLSLRPAILGTYSGTINVSSDAPGPSSAALSGQGIDPLRVLPGLVNFGTVLVDNTSLPQVQTLTNLGSGPITITGIAGGGVAAGDYSETDNCVGVTLNTGASCRVTTLFSPTTIGQRNASWLVSSNDPTGTRTLLLAGFGRQHMCGGLPC